MLTRRLDEGLDMLLALPRDDDLPLPGLMFVECERRLVRENHESSTSLCSRRSWSRNETKLESWFRQVETEKDSIFLFSR